MEEASNMPSSTQEFCLRWNNFHSSLVSAIDGFKNDSFFVDVTLACEGQFMQAHKMLLSACSVFFRDLLKANPCQHPIIILPTDVRFSDLEKMLRFIYQGEVNVQQEHLARFLKTAEMLKIRGLVEDNDKVVQSCSSPDSNETSTATDNHLSVIPKRPRLSLEPSSGLGSTENSHGGNTDKDDLSTSKDQEYSSDSEMLPVKQEMIELVRECDFGDGFPDEAFLRATGQTGGGSGVVDASSSAAIFRAAVSAASGSSLGCDALSSTHPPAPPPPPGNLLPSYVPPAPPQIKMQDDSSLPSSQEESSKGLGFVHSSGWNPIPSLSSKFDMNSSSEWTSTSSSSSTLWHRPQGDPLCRSISENPSSSQNSSSSGGRPCLPRTRMTRSSNEPECSVSEITYAGATHTLSYAGRKRLRCKRCRIVARDKRTKYKCSVCDVALCNSCFSSYHSELNWVLRPTLSVAKK